VVSTGAYFVKAQYVPNPACISIESEDVDITFSAPPVANFNAPAIACMGESVSFVNQSTTNGTIDKTFTWTFGDSQTSATENPTHQYTAANTFGVTLQVSYGSAACQGQITKNIVIESAPAAVITAAGNTFDLCPGDSIQLSIAGPFTSFQWNTGESTSSIFVKDAGTYDVDVTTANCLITATATIDPLPAPDVTVSADPLEIMEGGSSQLVASGLSTYLWAPPENLTDPAISDPVANPPGTTVYTVTGTDDNGCNGAAMIEVRVKGDLIVNKLTPAKFFSPENGDAINDSWLITNIQTYPQCQVSIYDDKGIKVYESKPYVEDWKGTYKGRPLPDGVYYYIIRCDGEEETPRSGSITILR
jgi:gliding motility-associated-like protein